MPKGTEKHGGTGARRDADGRIRELFADGGPLSEVMDGYRRRPEQEAYALAVAESLAEGGVLLADVPTGTGKSLAYLAAAVLREASVVVSTATVQLQSQLQTEDAPVLSRAIALMEGNAGGEGFTHGVIKGRGNFLCMRRHEESLREGTLIGGALMGKLDRFRTESETGDREDLDFAVPADVWREVASLGEDCSPRSCPYRDGCFVYAARERAADRDATFVNHAMLLANVAASGNVFDTEGRDLIIDEAHALEGVMNEAFGSSVSHARVLYSMRLARKKSDAAAAHADRAQAAADLFFDDLRRTSALGSEGAAPRAYETLKESLRSVKEALAADPKQEANELSGTVGKLSSELASFYAAPRPTHAYAVVPGGFGGAAGKGFVDKAGRRSAYPELKSWLVDTDEAFAGDLVPMFAGGGVSLCSATLAEGEGGGRGRSFSYVRRRLGLLEGESPAGRRVREHSGSEIFDYENRALVYVAEDLPDPAGRAGAGNGAGNGPADHAAACVRRAEELVALSGGRALILLSTNRAVSEFRRAFRPSYPVRFQGDDSTGRLVRWLRDSEDGGVLVGTRGMWQGLSVPGDAVGLVVLDKVPFVPPGDPVFEALKSRAGDAWFREVALPKARVAVRQGSGRLMRSDTDRGVIALLDPRIGTRGWGKAILRSLPPAPVTSSIEDVKAFFAP
jgi:ATP-dependent DNA helicase DinG